MADRLRTAGIALAVFLFFIWAFGRAIDAQAGLTEREGGSVTSTVAEVDSGLSVARSASRSVSPEHWQPGTQHNIRHAINAAWCGRASSYCAAGAQAWRVAYCETGGTMSVWASNGQYLGLFQMGAYARSRYGHSRNAWGQARAAHRYWLQAGWRPWECRP